jgi:Spy/CpxP family protein refolding chaperone
MKSKLFIAVALVTVATMLPAVLFAAREGKRSGRMERERKRSERSALEGRRAGAVAREGRRPERLARELGLDDAQIERIGRLRLEHRLGMIDLGAELRKLRLALRAELAAGTPDRAEIDRITGAIGEVRTKMQRQRIDHLLKVRDVLGDEQWKRFIERRRERDRGPKDGPPMPQERVRDHRKRR